MANLGEVAVEIARGVLEVGRDHADRDERRGKTGVERVEKEWHHVACTDLPLEEILHVLPRAEAQIRVEIDLAHPTCRQSGRVRELVCEGAASESARWRGEDPSRPCTPLVFGSHVTCAIILAGSKQMPNGRVRGSKPAAS
eukprot:3978090-Prymnesium_polylepis.1